MRVFALTSCSITHVQLVSHCAIPKTPLNCKKLNTSVYLLSNAGDRSFQYSEKSKANSLFKDLL